MRETENIVHEGLIKSIGQDTISIEINNNSMCDGCHAKQLCSSSESKIKIIEVIKPTNISFNIGDNVIIEGASSLGLKAVLLAYIIPLLFIVLVLLIGNYNNFSDGASGLLSIASLIPYYITLYICRNKLQRTLTFKIKQQ